MANYTLKPRRVAEIADGEARAWLGAMIEAEGCVTPHASRARGWRVEVTNKDPEVISAFLRWFGAGSVSYRPDSGVMVWYVDRRADVSSVAEQLTPYCMKVRKVQFDGAT